MLSIVTVVDLVYVIGLSILLFFFFKLKPAYEMRISDWSSDVCSSDLRPAVPRLFQCSEQSMRLVLLGAPGLGKGTQAARLKDHLQVPHVYTGDLLRAEVKDGSPLGRQAKEVMARGELVSEEILLGMLGERFSRDRKSTRLNSR